MGCWLQPLHPRGTFALPLQCTTRHSPLPWFPQIPPISFVQLGVPPRPPVGLHGCPLGQHPEVAGSGPQTSLPAGQADAVTAAALEAISIGAVQAVAAAALPPTTSRRREIWAWRPMCTLVPTRCAERFATFSNQPAIIGPLKQLTDAGSIGKAANAFQPGRKLPHCPRYQIFPPPFGVNCLVWRRAVHACGSCRAGSDPATAPRTK